MLTVAHTTAIRLDQPALLTCLPPKKVMKVFSETSITAIMRMGKLGAGEAGGGGLSSM